MRLRMAIAAALLLAGCHQPAAQDDAGDGEALANFAPPTADATPAPIRTLDDAVIRDLSHGKTAGVYLLDLRRVPAAVRAQVAAERAEAAACQRRGTNADAGDACARHEAMVAELKRQGWCWGPDVEVEADRRWIRRGPGCRN